MKKIITLMMIIVFHSYLWGAYLSNVPVTVTQPNGTIIECFASGDEYYNWLHDENGYTIIRHSETGYYCYAILDGEDLIASEYIVGTVFPELLNLKPHIMLSPEQILELLEHNEMFQSNRINGLYETYKKMLSDPNKERYKDEERNILFDELKSLLSDKGPGGRYDEVYVFRPNGTLSSDGTISNAYFSETSGRTTFSNSTNPFCFVANGNYGNIYIKNIRENKDSTLSFDVRFCNSADIVYSNTIFLPDLSNASNSIKTFGAVYILSTKNIIFEAGNEVILNSGFEVQLGGTFEINMNGCGEK